MAYSPYKVAGAATNWMDDYFKLNQKQKEGIALGKQQKGKTRVKFNKEVEKIQKSMSRARSKRKKGFFEKLVGDIAPLVLSAFLPIAGGALMGVKKGYDIDQQGKHTKRRSKYSLDAINKVMPKFAGTFVQPESTLGGAKREMKSRYEAADDMRNPLNILLQAGVEGVEGYAMGKAMNESEIFSKGSGDVSNILKSSRGGDVGIQNIVGGLAPKTRFTPFKALSGGGFKDFITGEGDNDEAALMMYLLNSIVQEGMDS